MTSLLSSVARVCVQAAIGSTALDVARGTGDEQLQKYGMDVLTVAVLAILVTAPVGALAIGLTGPRLLQRDTHAPGERHTHHCERIPHVCWSRIRV